jgi:hypothetical protein
LARVVRNGRGCRKARQGIAEARWTKIANFWTRTDHLVRRRQIGGVSDLYKIYFGGGERPPCGRDFLQPFQQHLVQPLAQPSGS